MSEPIFKCQCLSGSILETRVLCRTHYGKVTDTSYWFKLFLLYCYLKYSKHCDTLSRIIVCSHWVAWAMNKKGPGDSSPPPLSAAVFLWEQSLGSPLQTTLETAGTHFPAGALNTPIDDDSYTSLVKSNTHMGKGPSVGTQAPPCVHQSTLALAFLSLGWWEKGNPVPSLIFIWPRQFFLSSINPIPHLFPYGICPKF